MKGKMKGKMKGVLLIAVFLLTTLTGITFIPTVSASTAITADYILMTDGTSTADWSADNEPLGLYSVLLDIGAGTWTALEMTPPTGIKLSDLETITTGWSFWYYLSAGNGPLLELRFTGPGFDPDTGAEHIDISINTAELVFTTGAWTEEDVTSSSTATLYGNDEDGFFYDGTWGAGVSTGNNELSTLVGLVATLYDTVDWDGSDPADWELTRVRVELWEAGNRECYIDDVTIAGVTKEVEPQSLTVGQNYAISWTTADSVAVDLEYNPEGKTYAIDRTETSNEEGVVNFYNVIPTYAMNWKLSDLTGDVSDVGPDAPPTGPLYSDFLMEMIYGTEAVYFSVQPVEDYDIVVSPSSVDVESGTTVLTVTVTSDGEPVEDAYVSIEFWDNEAEEFYTLDTASLREYETQTASNGMAMFDIDVPEVAGTIYVTAGTDLGPELEGVIDGAYFDHWGYKTIPVNSLVGIKTTLSPTAYVEEVPHDLTITLTEIVTKALTAAGTGDAINITIVGDDITTDAVTAEAGITAIATILGGTVSGVSGVDEWKASISTTDSISLIGEVDASTIEIKLANFKSATDMNIVVSVASDIGGVSGSSHIDLLSETTKDADGLDDYSAASVTITVETAVIGSVYLVDLTEEIVAAAIDETITFTAYYTDAEGTDACDGWDVTLEYPTGNDVEYLADTNTLGEFSQSITADEMGVVAITITWTDTEAIPDITYVGTAEVPIVGFLISTDTTLFTVLEENIITVTVMNGTTIVNNAKVTLTTDADSGTLTSFEDNVIDGASDYVTNGQYIFHDVNSTVVAEIKATASKMVEETDTDFAWLTMNVVNNVLDISSSITLATALIDNTFNITVTENGTPIEDVVVTLNTTDSAPDTDEDGISEITINYDKLPKEVTAIKIDVVNDLNTKTGTFTLPVGLPLYLPNATFYLTAGIDSYGNFTIMSADGENMILVGTEGTNESLVLADFNITGLTTVFANGYLSFEILDEESTIALEKYDILEITAETAVTSPESAVVAELLIHNPIVSNTTYTGFPITYTSYVGQSQNFYVKVQDAGGVAVEGATVAIFAASSVASGDTNTAGETTITWEPTATGTYDLRLNEVLDIGVITVASYVAPQLAIASSPETVYLDDIVTLTVTADSATVGFATVSIVDPNGVTISRSTTLSGTCTFTADILGVWSMSVSKTDYTSATTNLEVLEQTPTEEPANTTGEQTLDSTGAPATSFAQGETVLASAEVSNVGTTSQTMLIVAQLKDPELRVLAPMYISVILAPGQSLTPSIGFYLPTTGYTAGTWTATIMVFDAWPAQGGVPIGSPVTISFTVTE